MWRSVFGCLLASVLFGCNPGVEVGLEFESPVIRMTPPGLNKTVGYVNLVNHTDKAITIVGAASASAGALEIHETTERDGLMAMRRLSKLDVPPQGEVQLQPNGKHLMLFRVKSLEVGQQVAVTLETSDGQTFTKDFEVVPLGYQG